MNRSQANHITDEALSALTVSEITDCIGELTDEINRLAEELQLRLMQAAK